MNTSTEEVSPGTTAGVSDSLETERPCLLSAVNRPAIFNASDITRRGLMSHP